MIENQKKLLMSSCWPFSSFECDRKMEEERRRHKSYDTIIAVAICPRLSVTAIMGAPVSPTPPRTALSKLVKSTVVVRRNINEFSARRLTTLTGDNASFYNLSAPSLTSFGGRGSLILRYSPLQVFLPLIILLTHFGFRKSISYSPLASQWIHHHPLSQLPIILREYTFVKWFC